MEEIYSPSFDETFALADNEEEADACKFGER
jgi:hypothetical protein